MMGSKQRSFAPLINRSLEDLVPPDHFYRHLERTLDLSFVRQFVQETYAGIGRPSIDPVVFFKLQLVMFFEGIRSERQLMRHAADRLSVLWYLGYDFGEPLPDHSSLTRIRERYGVNTTILTAKITPLSWWVSHIKRLPTRIIGGKTTSFMVGFTQTTPLIKANDNLSKPRQDSMDIYLCHLSGLMTVFC